MVGVSDTVKDKKTIHKGLRAMLQTYWESAGGGHVSIDFVLSDADGKRFRVEKSYTPRSEKYLRGRFSSADVARDYGKQFNKWVKEVNKRKQLRWK